MRPGPRLIRSLVWLSAVAVLVPIAHSLVWVLFSVALLLALVALMEWRALQGIRLYGERPAVVAISIGEHEEIPLAVHGNGAWPLYLTVRQRWPHLAGGGSSESRGLLRPGETLQFHHHILAVQRGKASLESPHVSFSRWRIWEKVAPLPVEGELGVLPNLKAVLRLHQRLNSFILRGLGQRMAPKIGKGREFDRLREYVKGDDFRDISWKSSARHRKPIVREYRLDRSQDVLICVDRGHRMAAHTTRIRRIDHAVNAAALLSYLCNRMEDRVGVLSFGHEVETGVGQGRGNSHLRQITSFLTGVLSEYVHTDYMSLAAHLSRRLHQRTLVLILTSLPEFDEQLGVVKLVNSLTPRHLPVLVVLKDPALDAAAGFEPVDHDELSRTLVARDLWTDRRRTIQALRQRGAWVSEALPHDLGVEAINSYLEIKSRQLL